MKRITLILGVVAVMVAMLVALAAPAMAQQIQPPPLQPQPQLQPVQHLPPVVPPVPPIITEPVDMANVEPGDTLFGIAQEHLGADAPPELIPDEVGRIHDLNRDTIGDNPHMIHPGQLLRLPSHR